jgi:crotonobetainyl-CoA:carnitine CoA-transferase CaiB-like acyl-CoA transferase
MTDVAVLQGIRVVDASRMIPGAVLARSLLALGAEVVKLEDPRGGDPMRMMPPLSGGVGVGFATYYAGARSVVARLGTAEGNAALRALVGVADVFVESFRPGTLAKWGVAPESLREDNPGLVTVSLPGFPGGVEGADDVAHDLNVLARSGLLARLADEPRTPRVQIADVTTGLLATQGVLAALLLRAKTGQGTHVEQPLCAGALPHVVWPWADKQASGAIGASERLIGGRCAAYGVYRCADDRALAVGCLEPKFWRSLCEVLGTMDVVHDGLRDDAAGARARARVAEVLATAPAHTWRERCADVGLPVDVVVDVDEPLDLPRAWLSPLVDQIPMPEGPPLSVPTRALPSFERAPRVAAPHLGEHTESQLRACGASASVIAACRDAIGTGG